MKTKITIADVAREAKVSAQTVSRVLNNKSEISGATRQQVREVIQRMGYRPSSIARGLATDKTMTLGLVVPDIVNPFFPEIARGAEDVARLHGYNIFLCNTIEDPEREEEVLSLLAQKRVDGLILCGSRLPDERLFPLLQEHAAVVVVNRPVPPEIAGSILIDDDSGTKQVIDHLVKSKRNNIGFLSGPANSRSSQARTLGFLAALRRSGRTVDHDLIVPCLPSLEGGLYAALTLLSKELPLDGLVCYNDLVAIGALQACYELGIRVPDDLAIIGCDDILLAGIVTPALTTLRVPKRDIGAGALSLLLQRIKADNTIASIVFKTQLIIRDSAP